MCGDQLIQRSTVQIGGEGLRAFGDAQPFQKHSLRCDAGVGTARGTGGAAEHLEIHMRGEVGLARIDERVGGRMGAHRLQRVTK